MTTAPGAPIESTTKSSDGIGVANVRTATEVLDRSLVHGLALTGAVKWSVQLMTWVTTIIVARLLSPTDFGILSLGGVFLVLVSMLAESGIGSTLVAIPSMSSNQIFQLNGAALLLGLASFLVVTVAAVPLGMFYHSPVLPRLVLTMAVGLLIGSARTVPSALLQRDMRFARLAAIDAIQAVTQSALTLILALLGFRYWSLAIAGVAGTVVATALVVWSRSCRYRWPRVLDLRPVMGYTREVLATRLLWYSYQNADFIVAGRRLGAEALGGYSYAWTLASIPVDKITALVGSITPSIFSAVQGDQTALRRYFLAITEGLSVLVFPLTTGLALTAREFVPIVFGARWVPMIVPLQLLAIYASIRAIVPPASNVLFVTGDTRFLLKQSAVAAVALPVAFLIGSQWGTFGIAVAWMVAHPLIVALPTFLKTRHRLGMSLGQYLGALRPASVGVTLLAVGVFATKALLTGRVSVLALLLLEALVGGTVYTAYVTIFHGPKIRAVRDLLQRGPISQT